VPNLPRHRILKTPAIDYILPNLVPLLDVSPLAHPSLQLGLLHFVRDMQKGQAASVKSYERQVMQNLLIRKISEIRWISTVGWRP
jgi:hypothetical protein